MFVLRGANMSAILRKASRIYFFMALTLAAFLYWITIDTQNSHNTNGESTAIKSKKLSEDNSTTLTYINSSLDDDFVSQRQRGVTINVAEIDHTTFSPETENKHDDVTYKPYTRNRKSRKPQKRKFNVLFIVADDLRPQLGSYKGPYNPNPRHTTYIHTPNLDALAAKSLQLNRAFVQFSVCSPSRASYMTSRRPDTTKVWDLETFWRESGGNFTTIPQFFKENGYRTQGMGKIYHPGHGGGDNDPLSWSEPYYYEANGLFYQLTNDSWWAVPQDFARNKPLHDEEITDFAIQFMTKHAKEARTGKDPFFLAVGFQKPHIPFVFPARYLQHYPIENIQLADNPYAPANFPKLAWFHIEGSNYKDIQSYHVSGDYNVTLPDHGAKLYRRAYFACITFIDDMVGRLTRAVTDLGLDGNTIITFIGDHGFHLGENGMWGKHTNLEQSTHAPMMMYIPRTTEHGIKTDSLVEFVDLFPTLTEAAGLGDIPRCPRNSSNVKLCTEGVSFYDLTRSPKLAHKHSVMSQVQRYKSIGYTLRTKRYRYVEWMRLEKTHVTPTVCRYDIQWETSARLGRELYDHVQDPDENVNIAGSFIHAKVVAEFSKELRARVDPTIINNCAMSQ